MCTYIVLSVVLPLVISALAILGTVLRTMALSRAATAPCEAFELDATTWATRLEADLAATPEAPCPVMARVVSLGLVADPWVMPAALAAKLVQASAPKVGGVVMDLPLIRRVAA